MHFLISFLLIAAITNLVKGDCFQTPSNPECVDYTFPEHIANEDVISLCEDMPYMIGCSVQKICKYSNINSKYCSNLSFLHDICRKDPQMDSMNGCSNLLRVCKQDTVVKECKENKALPSIIGTDNTRNAISDQCESNSNLPGCSLCRFEDDIAVCNDYLEALTLNCAFDANLKGCTKWKKMSEELPSELNILCSNDYPHIETKSSTQKKCPHCKH